MPARLTNKAEAIRRVLTENGDLDMPLPACIQTVKAKYGIKVTPQQVYVTKLALRKKAGPVNGEPSFSELQAVHKFVRTAGSSTRALALINSYRSLQQS